MENLRADIIGINSEVNTVNGKKDYVFFDNGASTPGFKSVYEKLKEFMHNYSNVHRGSGYKSYFATEVYEQSREIVKKFVGADDNQVVIFIKNTTEGINKLARILRKYIGGGKVVITDMEHHSNLLPWLKYYKTIVWETDDEGKLHLEELERILSDNKDVRLVAVTGTSNITGYVNPVNKIAKIAHSYGVKIFVDGAQLVPHKPVNMKGKEEDERIDFLVFSAHKIYAPYGSGALIGDRDLLDDGCSPPEFVGGGTVKFVTFDEILWAELPDKEEAGTPNIPGAVALALTLKRIEEVGMDKIDKHERELSEYFEKNFHELKNFTLVGEARDSNSASVFSFTHKELSPFLVASVLSYEEGIGVRAGCFCAHPYMMKLLGFSADEIEGLKKKIIKKQVNYFPGAVRASLGCYNTKEEIDRLFEILRKIDDGMKLDHYKYDKKVGNYVPESFRFEEVDFFNR